MAKRKPILLRITPFEATLVLGRDVEVIPAHRDEVVDGVTGKIVSVFETPEYRIVRPPMPPRRAVSIEEFERDMKEARQLAIAGDMLPPRVLVA